MRWLALLVVAGCAGSTVRTQATSTDGLIATARDNGAQRCAPVELAMAESHNDFAEHALDEGNYFDAKHAASIAESNANLAIEKSPPAKCKVYGDRDGDGIPDNIDKCPDSPEDKDGFQDADGCPDPDNDGDGIPDTVDKCPNEPEDKDGFQDADGCPDPDNDQDGIPDVQDQCPNDPEDKDGFEDADGCPDPDNDKDGFLDKDDKCPNDPGVAPDGCPRKYNLVVVTEKKIELKQTVYFDFNKSTIKPVSFALLNEVAQAMADNPKIKVEIGGHTDSVGDDNFNLKLSQARAESVRLYLVKRGIDAMRMVPKGYGENVPIADNRTAEGRSQNRRVEFLITER
ncbi:MAG TPA: OmpA family protein [Kofleriaceae bacterium]|nr:OmpA family protein [Kofleriaceae bacterium]